MENSYSPEDHEHDNHPDCTDEESGWTAYFQDFSNDNKKKIDGDEYLEGDIISCEYSICTSSSLLSDAASYAAWKIKTPISHNPLKRLTFKKTRASQVIHEDDSLEDTASSPVNSPKVGDLIKTKPHTDDLIVDSTRKRGTSEYYSEENQKERGVVDFDAKNECIDLKKRGLCLVPLSMLMNYHA